MSVAFLRRASMVFKFNLRAALLASSCAVLLLCSNRGVQARKPCLRVDCVKKKDIPGNLNVSIPIPSVEDVQNAYVRLEWSWC